MNARLYDPVLGRFVNPDPRVYSPDLSNEFNRYMYARNNPMMYNDPNGEFAWLLFAAITAAKIYLSGVQANHGEFNFRKWENKPSYVIGYSYSSNGNWNVNASAGWGNNLSTGIGLGKTSGSYSFNYTYGQVKGSFSGTPTQMLSNFQASLDVAGCADPTGVADGLNSIIYAGRGQWKDAGISLAGIILPYAGDALKAGRLGAKGMEAVEKMGIWSSTKELNSVENAFGHWTKHSIEFPEYYNSKQYVEGAMDFLHNSPNGTLMRTRINGDVLKYDPITNTFGVMNKFGVPKTMFRPVDGLEYWLRIK